MTKPALGVLAAVLVASTLAAAPAVAAERKVGQKPDAGIEAVAAIGTSILEKFDMVAVSTPKLRDDFEISLGIQGKIRIPSNSAMQVQRASPLKACTVAEDTYIDAFVGPRGAACLMDTDGDGTFDKATADAVLFTTKKIKPPVPYDLIDAPADPSSSYMRQTLTYLGTGPGVLRVSYREFSHDMARPAFTEELSFPLAATYPQMLAWRDTKITLLGLDGNGLRYRIEPVR